MILSIFGSPVVILENNDISTLFPDALYNELVNYILSNSKKFESTDGQSRGGTSFSGNVLDMVSSNKINSLTNFLKKISLEYVHVFTDKKVLDIKLTNSTVNLIQQGTEVENHIDLRSEYALSVLFYPKMPINSGNLVFMHNSAQGDWASDYLDCDIVSLDIKQGSIIILDSETLHAVNTHKSTDLRMSIHNEFSFVL